MNSEIHSLLTCLYFYVTFIVCTASEIIRVQQTYGILCNRSERWKVRERVHREQRPPRPARRRFWTLLKRCLLRKAMRRRASRRSVTWPASRVDCRTTFSARRSNSTEPYWSEHLRCLCHNS